MEVDDEALSTLADEMAAVFGVSETSIFGGLRQYIYGVSEFPVDAPSPGGPSLLEEFYTNLAYVRDNDSLEFEVSLVSALCYAPTSARLWADLAEAYSRYKICRKTALNSIVRFTRQWMLMIFRKVKSARRPLSKR